MTSTTDADNAGADNANAEPTPRPRRRTTASPAPASAPPKAAAAPPPPTTEAEAPARKRRTVTKAVEPAVDAPATAPKATRKPSAKAASIETAPPETSSAKTAPPKAASAKTASAETASPKTATAKTATAKTATNTATKTTPRTTSKAASETLPPPTAVAASAADATVAPRPRGRTAKVGGSAAADSPSAAADAAPTTPTARATTPAPRSAPTVPPPGDARSDTRSDTRSDARSDARSDSPAGRGPGDFSDDRPVDRPVDRPIDGDGDGRREGYRTNRRRRRGRGDGAREPGGYARGPVPPTGDIIRPRESTNEPRARDPQQSGGWRRDDAIRDTRRTDAGRIERRDDGPRPGPTPRDDRRSGGQQQGGQQQGGSSQGGSSHSGSSQSGSSQGGSSQSGQRQGGQRQSGQRQGGQQGDSRYGGGRGGQQGGGQQGAGQTGGGRHDGGRTGARTDGGRGSGRFEGRGRHTGPFRDRDAQRPPASPPEDWDAPAPGGLEVGGQAGADWVSYEDRIAAEEGRRPAGQQVTGYIELSKNGNGILRAGGLAGRTDPVMPMRLLRLHGLRSGDLVDGLARGTQVVEVNQVNGHDPVDLAKRPHFDTLTAVHPDKALLLGATADNLTGRLLDLVAPVGRGQRGLIVAPPKAGKTTLLKDMANGLAHDPKLTLLICLVGERPEEVTDMRRSTNCTVLAADMDLPTEDHTRVAEICVEHAKRLVEEGKHVVILMDSLTRLARAYNLSIKGGGSRTLSGGMDAGALQPVRKFFGAARCAEGGGSLTILATCLVDTGSRLDDLVYEEFKGTGNMEVHLDRKLSELRLFPAVDIRRSGTRREELLFDAKMLEQVHTLRRQLAPLEPAAALTAMLDALRKQAMPDGSLAGR